MGTPKGDRIYSITRIVSASVILVLLLAFFALYIYPDHTDIDFAWTILPRTSAILIGAGYTAGAFFFARLLAEKKWHRLQAGFLPITLFTVCMFIATLLHWGRFHQGALAFYLWTIIYALTPFIVPFIWWRNRATASSDLDENDLRFSRPVRWGLGIFALIGILSFVVIFIQPSILIPLSPWKLTELTARVFCGWSLLTFATVLMIAVDGRWSSTRILLESALVALFLTLVSLPRMWADLDPGKPMTYVFVAGMVLATVAFIVIHVWLDRSSRAKPEIIQRPVVEE
jgi:hypothetical protein